MGSGGGHGSGHPAGGGSLVMWQGLHEDVGVFTHPNRILPRLVPRILLLSLIPRQRHPRLHIYNFTLQKTYLINRHLRLSRLHIHLLPALLIVQIGPEHLIARLERVMQV